MQQKNEAYVQCQNELTTYQNLFYHQKKKTEEFDVVRATLAEREQQLSRLMHSDEQHRTRQSELQCQLDTCRDKIVRCQSSLDMFEQMQLDLRRATHERDVAIVQKKQLEHQISSMEEQRVRRRSSDEQRHLTNDEQLPTGSADADRCLVRLEHELNTVQQASERIADENRRLADQLERGKSRCRSICSRWPPVDS
jgi:DNA repair exonuclease SbcCD ATPase subunit